MTKIIALVIIALIVVGGLFMEFRRGGEMGHVAKRLGFSFKSGQQKLSGALDSKGFDLFTQGPPLINNRMEGVFAGRRVVLFDYSYQAIVSREGSRDVPVRDDQQNLETRSQTVIWVQLEQPLPDFDLSPTGIHQRTVGQRMGLGAVSFDAQPEFNARYRLLARDAERTRALFQPALLESLLEHPGLVIEARGPDLLFYRFEQRLKPEQLEGFLGEVALLLERFP